jgi:hypothetical protein
MSSPSCLFVCMCITLTTTRQRLGKHVPAATNIHAATKEFLDVLFLFGPCRMKGT